MNRGLVLIVLMSTVAWPGLADAQILFDYLAPDGTIPYDVNTGVGSELLTFRIVEDQSSQGFPNQVDGWAMGNGHDAALLDITEVEQGAYIQSLNGGSGPDFWSATVLSGGFTVGTVYSFGGYTECYYDVPKEVVDVTYNTVAPALAGDQDGETTLLEFSNDLGDPPVENVIVLAGAPYSTNWVTGTVELEPNVFFVRGDCNSSGTVDVSDPVFLQNYLFLQFESPTCFDACDHNDDGVMDIADVIYILNFLFAGGPPQPAPSRECGPDPTDDGLDCESAVACP